MNKSGKDMSADELVRQLNEVLGIDGEENEQKESAPAPSAAKPSDAVKPSTAASLDRDMINDLYSDELIGDVTPEPKKKHGLFGRKDKKKKSDEDEKTELPSTAAPANNVLLSEKVNDASVLPSVNSGSEPTHDESVHEADDDIDLRFLLDEDDLPESEEPVEEPVEESVEESDEESVDKPEEQPSEDPKTNSDESSDDDMKVSAPDVSKSEPSAASGQSEDEDEGLSDFVNDVFAAQEPAADEGETREFAPVVKAAKISEDEQPKPAPEPEQTAHAQAPAADTVSETAVQSAEEPDNTDNFSYNKTELDIMDALFDDNTELPEGAVSASGREKPSGSDYLDDMEPVHTEHRKKKRETISFSEFTCAEQRKPFLKEYRRIFRAARLRRNFSVIFFVLLAVYEALPVFGVSYPYFCNPRTNPGVFVLIGLQLFVLCAAFAYEELLKGLKKLFSGGCPESLTLLVTILTLFYGFSCAFAGISGNALFMTPAAFMLVCTLFGKTRSIKREVLSFRVVSSVKPKYVMETYRSKPEDAEEKEFYDYLPEDPIMLRVCRASFVDGFAEANSRPSVSKTTVGILLPLIFLASVGMFVAGLLTGGFSLGAEYGYITALCCAPSAIFLASTLPAYICANKAYDIDSAVVSEKAVRDYVDASVLSFSDEDVYPASNIKMQKIKLYGDVRVDHVLFVISSLLSKTGGSLAKVFIAASVEFGKTDDVVVKAVHNDGIEALVNSEYILIGSAEFMEKENYIPLHTRQDDISVSNNETRIMYFAAGGEICAKFYFTYVMDEDFISLIKQLTAADRCLAIKTFDPNIDTALLSSDIDVTKYPVRILKCGAAEKPDAIKPSSRGAIVTKNSPKALLKTLTLCDRMYNGIKMNLLICWLCTVIGILLSLFVIFTNMFPLVNCLYILIYQLLFIIAAAIISRIHI